MESLRGRARKWLRSFYIRNSCALLLFLLISTSCSFLTFASKAAQCAAFDPVCDLVFVDLRGCQGFLRCHLLRFLLNFSFCPFDLQEWEARWNMLRYCVTYTCIPRTVFSLWIHCPCTARPHPSSMVYIRGLRLCRPWREGKSSGCYWKGTAHFRGGVIG